MRLTAALFATAFALAACDDTEVTEMSTPMRTGTSAAETACIDAVNTNYGRPVASITSSEFSEAGSEVMLRSEDGTNWRCLASNAGQLEDLAAVS